jgi:hypothetical protein
MVAELSYFFGITYVITAAVMNTKRSVKRMIPYRFLMTCQ